MPDRVGITSAMSRAAQKNMALAHAIWEMVTCQKWVSVILVSVLCFMMPGPNATHFYLFFPVDILILTSDQDSNLFRSTTAFAVLSTFDLHLRCDICTYL